MRKPAKKMSTSSCMEEEIDQLRRGPWTLEEDNLLISYIACHGEGRWNSLAKSSGLKRTGKSCRLRWLNYLKPDIKRGNLTPQEQLLILELHSKWGNRWSKIAQHLPGRTDNEIKNYWRTRVQKQARHLKIDSNSKRFVEALRRFWMPRLLEKVEQSSSSSASMETNNKKSSTPSPVSKQGTVTIPSPQPNKTEEINSSSSISSSDSMGMLLPELPQDSQPQTSPYGAYFNSTMQNNDYYYVDISNFDMLGSSDMSASDFQMAEADWMYDDMAAGTVWNIDELWQFRK